jgi:hypothetical protein
LSVANLVWRLGVSASIVDGEHEIDTDGLRVALMPILVASAFGVLGENLEDYFASRRSIKPPQHQQQ